ncbi:hypothetical protein NAEGRDRAFT_79252 [Naegleria gruberi]|uniref:RGS domain-containing protein n=1 Tax=Naegleria gruberi TaxID=5762 RepID=D2VAW4_NAEGR|nr:uncharacterized protein NAEGRDRAFT_79252 [Naegleria gruberi]EFC46151.1 hypothetical protein NAEGRDRAFT_79252 [Naegleria gruberi]|eukprot:XP_002678895.1 hypothetical protein NAEGRDRAFT_79252 [Naegleria gruberi strain NEG-M]
MVNDMRNFPGQCPDVLSVPILSGLCLGVYLMLVVSSIIGFVWNRNSDHIRARTIAGMFFTLVSSFFVFTIFSLRFIIGREIFPCILFSLVFFLMPPCFSIPTIIRCLRVYVQWRFNLLKESKFRENEKQNDIVTVISSVYSSPNSPNTLIPVMVYRAPVLKTIRNKIASHQNLKQIEKFFIYSNYILQSHKWLISIFLAVYGFHIIFWFSLAIFEDSLHPNSRFLMEDESMLSFEGCYALESITYIGGITYCVYLIIQLVCLVLLLKTEKDTYFIKVESILILILQVVCVGLYITLGQSFYRVVDHIIPAGLIMFLYLSLEIIVTVTLPVIYSIMKRYQKVEVFDSELEWALNKSETCEMLLEYSRRSFCPEGVLVYKDISKFKLASTFKKRKLLAFQVVDNYLTFGGVYELNMPNIHLLREEILFKIDSATCEEEMQFRFKH